MALLAVWIVVVAALQGLIAVSNLGCEVFCCAAGFGPGSNRGYTCQEAMPKLYEYLGIVVLFYSNEHEPVHVHGKRQGRETKAELIIENGKVARIVYSNVAGRRSLSPADLKHFQTLVENYADEIVQKWIDYFVLHKPIEPKKITQRIN